MVKKLDYEKGEVCPEEYTEFRKTLIYEKLEMDFRPVISLELAETMVIICKKSSCTACVDGRGIRRRRWAELGL